MRSNLCPTYYAAVYNNVADLPKPLHACIHLRSLGIDARYCTTPSTRIKVVLVPPEQLKKAQRLVAAYRKRPTDWRDDYRKIRARERAAERAGAA